MDRKKDLRKHCLKDSKYGGNYKNTDPRNSVDPKQKKYEENDTTALHNLTP